MKCRVSVASGVAVVERPPSLGPHHYTGTEKIIDAGKGTLGVRAHQGDGQRALYISSPRRAETLQTLVRGSKHCFDSVLNGLIQAQFEGSRERVSGPVTPKALVAGVRDAACATDRATRPGTVTALTGRRLAGDPSLRAGQSPIFPAHGLCRTHRPADSSSDGAQVAPISSTPAALQPRACRAGRAPLSSAVALLTGLGSPDA